MKKLNSEITRLRKLCATARKDKNHEVADYCARKANSLAFEIQTFGGYLSDVNSAFAATGL